jgi:hypothetical protein
MNAPELIKKFEIILDKVSQFTSAAFTKDEICMHLNNASLSIAMKKFTGNNAIGAPFEAGFKRITDLQSLVENKLITTDPTTYANSNVLTFENAITTDMLVVIGATLIGGATKSEISNVAVISNDVARRFNQTEQNIPWIDAPVCTIAANSINLIVDPIDKRNYINKVDKVELDIQYVRTPVIITATSQEELTDYPDSMWLEVVQLAVSMALDNVESPRLQSHQAISQSE